MPDLDVKKTNEHLWTLIWGAIIGVIACAVALIGPIAGIHMSGNPLADEPARAIVSGFIVGAGAHELKLWVSRRLSGRR